jgi:2-isopropylmalate synthase
LERDHGYALPRALQVEMSAVVQRMTEETGSEVSSEDIVAAFEATYIAPAADAVVEHSLTAEASGECQIAATVVTDGVRRTVAGRGNGPIDAFTRAVRDASGVDVRVVDYHEHALGSGAAATAVAYVEVAIGGGTHAHGVGRDANIITASLRAVLCAVERSKHSFGRIVADTAVRVDRDDESREEAP